MSLLTNTGVNGHEDDRRWSGDLLADPEQQAEDGEWADVHTWARDGAEDPTQEASAQQHQSLPDSEALDGVERLALVLPESSNRNKKRQRKVQTKMFSSASAKPPLLARQTNQWPACSEGDLPWIESVLPSMIEAKEDQFQ